MLLETILAATVLFNKVTHNDEPIPNSVKLQLLDYVCKHPSVNYKTFRAYEKKHRIELDDEVYEVFDVVSDDGCND